MEVKEAWYQAAKLIFKEPFLDQLREENKCDVEREIDFAYDYLRREDFSNLQDDIDPRDLAQKLGVSLPEIPQTSQREVLLHTVAKLFMERVHGSLSDGGLNSVNEYLGTLSENLNNVDAGALDKCAGPAPRENNVPRPIARGRLQDIHRDVNMYIRPVLEFQETESFKTVTQRILDHHAKVVIVHGMSASGKSQIARALCQKIDETRPRFLISHVQCQESGSAIVKQWKRFVKKLFKKLPNQILPRKASEIMSDLDSFNCRSFVHMLEEQGYDFLLVVEDATTDNEKRMMCDLVSMLLSPTVKKIQLLSVTQKEEALFSKKSDCDYIKISGLEENEAITFLKRENSIGDKGIADLACKLAYSPLRLVLARKFCLKYQISYESYCNNLGKKDIIEREKKMLKEYPGLGHHTYEVIMNILTPQNNAGHDEKEERWRFEIVKMMSFLADADIPDILLGAFLKEITTVGSVEDEERQVKYICDSLKDDCDMTMDGPVLSKEYGLQRAIIHNDILIAVQFSMDDDDKRKVILQVLGAAISLVGKENRIRTDNVRLLDMMNHLISISTHALKLLESNINLERPDMKNFQLLTYLSRLYEVLAFSATQASGETWDGSFEKAVDYLWSIACYDSGYSIAHILKCIFGPDSNAMHSLLHYEVGKDPGATANNAYKQLRSVSLRIPIATVKSNCHRFFPLSKGMLTGMKAKVPEDKLSEMEHMLEENGVLTDDQIKQLEQYGGLLKPEILQKMYLPECIASILHTRGRQVLYSKQTRSPEDKKMYDWYSNVALELCKITSHDLKVKTIFEYIIEANNKLPRMLHILSEPKTDNDFQKLLTEICDKARFLKDVQSDFYEHGVYKCVSGTPFTVMNALKYLVKANTKVYKRPHILENFAMPQAKNDAKELYDLAKKHSNFAAASNCMIHVGKYYAAVGKYEKAFEAFENGFDYKGRGINYQLTRNTNIYSWALYNYGRALYASNGGVQNVVDKVARFTRRYETLAIPEQWRAELDDMKDRVDKLVGK